MTLTHEQIDRLEGRELDRVMCLHDGAYHAEGNLCKIEGHGWSDIPHYHSNLGAAMGLLLQFTNDSCHSVLTHVYESGGQAWLSVYEGVLALHEGKPLASGPKSEAASIICRDYLKLKNRSDGR